MNKFIKKIFQEFIRWIKKNYICVLFSLLLLLLYIFLSVHFENRLYPSSLEERGKSDFFRISFGNTPECLSRDIGTMRLDLESNKVIIEDLTLKNNCSIKQLNMTIEITNMTDCTINCIREGHNCDFLFEKKFNKSTNTLTLIINVSLMENHTRYYFLFTGNVGKMFSNYYQIFSPDITRLFFGYSRDPWHGYLCGENCFNIIGGVWDKQDPVYYTKKYELNKNYPIAEKEFVKVESPSFLFTFNPKSRKYILLQKIIDAVILAVVAILGYELLKSFLKEKIQFDGKKQKLMKLSMRNLRQIVNLEKLKVKDNKKEGLVKKIIEAREK